VTEASYLTTTRTAYDTLAAAYVDFIRDEMAAQPFDRAMLAVFAETVQGPVMEIGCGPGRISAHLHDLGVQVSGIDLSPEMIAIARKTYPHLRFDVGSMTELDLPEGGLGGIVAWYSLFYIPPEQQPPIFAAFHRALAPGGSLLLAFQVGEDHLVHQPNVGGFDVELFSYRLDPERVGKQLADAGFVMHARLVREPNQARNEKAPQAYLMACKPD
jgi:SAM-dependent methyltransferase